MPYFKSQGWVFGLKTSLYVRLGYKTDLSAMLQASISAGFWCIPIASLDTWSIYNSRHLSFYNKHFHYKTNEKMVPGGLFSKNLELERVAH